MAIAEDIWGTKFAENGSRSRPNEQDLGGSGAGPVGITGSRHDPTYISAFSWLIPEYNPNLIGFQAVRTYDQMRRSDSQVRASLRMVKAPVLSAQWFIEPASDSDQDRMIAEDVWWTLNHMPAMNGQSRPFVRFLREALSFLDFGFYTFEAQWKTIEDFTPPASDLRQRPRARAFTMLQDLAPRHPIRTQAFIYNEHGQVEGMKWGVQNADIPLDKLVLFSFEDEGDDPSGMSILRSAYFHWYAKTNLYKFDGIQKERMSIGIPDVEVMPGASPKDIALAQEMARNMRTNEKAYMVHPQNIKPGYLDLPNAPVSPLESAVHHGLMILQNVLVQFLSLGTQESGSRAVGGTQTEAFLDALRYVSDYMRGVLNTQIVPKIVQYNWDTDQYPEVKVRHLRENDIWRSLSVALRNFVEPGILTPDLGLEELIRFVLELPKPSEEVRKRSIEDRVLPMPEKVTERIQVPGSLGAQGQLEPAAAVATTATTTVPAGQSTNPGGSRKGSRTGGPKE